MGISKKTQSLFFKLSLASSLVLSLPNYSFAAEKLIPFPENDSGGIRMPYYLEMLTMSVESAVRGSNFAYCDNPDTFNYFSSAEVKFRKSSVLENRYKLKSGGLDMCNYYSRLKLKDETIKFLEKDFKKQCDPIPSMLSKFDSCKKKYNEREARIPSEKEILSSAIAYAQIYSKACSNNDFGDLSELAFDSGRSWSDLFKQKFEGTVDRLAETRNSKCLIPTNNDGEMKQLCKSFDDVFFAFKSCVKKNVDIIVNNSSKQNAKPKSSLGEEKPAQEGAKTMNVGQ